MGVGRSSSSSSVPSSIRTLDFSRNSISNASKLEMARLLAVLCLASVAVAQDRYWGSYSASYPAGGGGDSGSVAESRASFEWAQFGSANAQPVPQQRTSTPRRAPASSRVSAPRATPAPRAPVVPRVVEKSIYSTEAVEPGQYVHNPERDLTPYQLWKRKQAAKKGLQQPSVNSLPEPARKVVTVRKQKPRVQQAAAAPQQSRFQNFQQVEQQRSSPVYQQQQQPRREQAYYQPAPQQPVQPAYQQPAFKQQTFQQPQQPQRAAYQQPQPVYQQQAYQQPQQLAAYPRAQHQTYTPEYIFEANNN